MTTSRTCTPKIKTVNRIASLTYIPCGVMLGRVGVGKTTLFNMLCGTAHLSGEASASLTQQLYLHSVNCGNYPFYLIDTPGTNSKHDTYKHAVLIRESLTAKKINTIFIIIKYESRFEEMLDAFLDVQELVYNYNQKVVVMISHWDACKQTEKAFGEICTLFNNCCANIICYSENSSPVELATLMYSCLANMRQDMLDIPDEEFFLRYNICEQKASLTKSLKQYEIDLKMCFKDYTDQLQTILREHEYLADLDDILHYMIAAFRNEVQDTGEQFIRKYSGEVSEMHYFTLYIKIQKTNIKSCDEFIELVVPNMSYNPSDKDDPRNMIKTCPHCNQVWFKTEGCDGATICGSVPQSYFDVVTKSPNKQFFKYIFQRVNGVLQFKKNAVDSLIASSKVTRITSNSGCGRSIVWKDCAKVSDDKILELFKVQTFEQAKQLMKEAKFKEIRNTVESTFDKQFHME